MSDVKALELKPCAWCATVPMLEDHFITWGYPPQTRRLCRGCGALGPSVEHEENATGAFVTPKREEVDAAWNRRHPDENLVRRVVEMARAPDLSGEAKRFEFMTA
jgi:hypothetical protein